MEIRKMFPAVVLSLAMITSIACGKTEETRSLKVGDTFTVTLQENASTPVRWYLLMPTGPQIELVDIKTVPLKASTSTVKSSTVRMVGAASSDLQFTFRAIKSTGSASFAVRFVKMDFSDQVYDSHKVVYSIKD